VRRLLPLTRRRKQIGPVLPLAQHDCDQGCRALCFEALDPSGLVIRLSHGHWRGVLAKQNRASMARHVGDVERAIRHPREIHADGADRQHSFYYVDVSDRPGKLLFVDVKCLPRRF
jgi:hypothetical protein